MQVTGWVLSFRSASRRPTQAGRLCYPFGTTSPMKFAGQQRLLVFQYIRKQSAFPTWTPMATLSPR
jgi:hypothetical protein